MKHQKLKQEKEMQIKKMIDEGPELVSKAPKKILSMSPSSSRRFLSPQPQRSMRIDMFNFQPKINKNTEKLIKNREARAAKPRCKSPPSKPSQTLTFKASDKILIMKFNKEFDQIRDEIFKMQNELVLRGSTQSARGPKKADRSLNASGEILTVRETETSFTYQMVIFMLIRLGFLPDSKNPKPDDHPLAR